MSGWYELWESSRKHNFQSVKDEYHIVFFFFSWGPRHGRVVEIISKNCLLVATPFDTFGAVALWKLDIDMLAVEPFHWQKLRVSNFVLLVAILLVCLGAW